MEKDGKLEHEVEADAGKTDEKKILPKEGILLDDKELNNVSGGCGEITMIIGDSECDCSGQMVRMTAIGTDSTGRIIYYRCPLCGKEKAVYG